MRTSNSCIYIKDNKRNLLHFQSIPFFLAPSPKLEVATHLLAGAPPFITKQSSSTWYRFIFKPSLSLQPSSSSTHLIKETATTQVHNYLLSSISYSFTPYPTNNPSQSSPDPPTKKKNSMQTKPLPHELPSRKVPSSLYIKPIAHPPGGGEVEVLCPGRGLLMTETEEQRS